MITVQSCHLRPDLGFRHGAPSAGLERATYCFGGHFPACCNLRIRRSLTAPTAREWP